MAQKTRALETKRPVPLEYVESSRKASKRCQSVSRRACTYGREYVEGSREASKRRLARAMYACNGVGMHGAPPIQLLRTGVHTYLRLYTQVHTWPRRAKSRERPASEV